MKSYLGHSARLIILSLLPVLLLAQHSPFTKSGYDDYLPEVRKWNTILTAIALPDISTPSGLARSRNLSMPVGKLILRPSDQLIPGREGNIRLRVFRPDSIRAVVLDIHGGAWISGKPEYADSLNEAMARYCKVAVVSIDYRLAPENPFSAEVEDCDSVAAWLFRNAKKEFGVSKLILTGGSAGANLAALCLLDIRDKLHAIDRVLGIDFFYGAFDLSRTPSARRVGPHTLIIDSAYVSRVYQIVFAGKSAEDLRSPSISPLYADLKGLPPAFFSVGTYDPLLDDTMFMSDRWEAAGNDATVYVYPECPHAFNFFPTKIAKLANQRVNDWIKGLLK